MAKRTSCRTLSTSLLLLEPNLILFASAEPADQSELAQDRGRILRAAEDVLPQRLRRQVSDEVLQESQGRTPGNVASIALLSKAASDGLITFSRRVHG